MKMQRSIHSQKFAEKRRKKRQALLILVCICLVTVSAAFVLLLRVPFLQIKSIEVAGSTYAPDQAISATALSALSGSYFHLAPFSNTFFYSKKAIKTAVEGTFKEVKDIKVHRDGFSGLKIDIVERVPAAVVCAGFRADAGEGDCYFSDDQGYVFASAATSSLESQSLSHYYIPTETGTTTIGFNFISKNIFSDLQNFLKGAAKAGLMPLGVLIGEKGEYEMYIKSRSGNSETTVYFDDRSSFEKTLGNLLTFWQNSNLIKKEAATGDLDYINLRFGNTVYYSTE